ncbi:MAG: LPXTG cell wall anchor domain-containing protein [Clostridia bacterium]|nr:LPXTG cell wall anchor domain-containing protein [Clostridia bacterium]
MPEIPKTGDGGKPGIWLGMILGGLAVLLLSQRAKNGKETQC